METEIQLAHFKKSYYVILITFVIVFIISTCCLGIFGPNQYIYDTTLPQNDDHVITNSKSYFDIPSLNDYEMDLIVSYRQTIVPHNISSFVEDAYTETIIVNFYDENDKINETREFEFKCSYRDNQTCGSVVVINQKVYRKGDGILEIHLKNPIEERDFETIGSIKVIKTNKIHTEINISYGLLTFLVSIIIFAAFLVIEIRYILKRGKVTILQVMNCILLIGMLIHTFPWSAISFSLQWIGVIGISTGSFAAFNVVFFGYLFFMLDTFSIKDGTKIPHTVWISRCILLLLYLIVHFTSTIIHTIQKSEYVLIPDNTLYSVTVFCDVIEGLIIFFLYAWAIYSLAMTYNKITIPIIQQQLSYFAFCSGVFIIALLCFLLFGTFLTDSTTLGIYFEAGSIVIYVVLMLAAFSPSLSPVRNEWSIFYNELDNEQLLYNED
ncbi:Wntless-like transmembrane domain-containing protein [Entamoeba marina]